MTTDLLAVGIGFNIISVFSLVRRGTEAAAVWSLGSAVAFTALSLADLHDGDWQGAGVTSVIAAAWWWTWSRRGGGRKKRSLKALGEKIRKVFEEMARNMPRPGPVLRPAPDGAS